MAKVPVTPEGMAALRAELDQLKKVERPRIVKEIELAREHGDLRENAEYHAAKDQQGMIEARIRDIELKLANAQVIDVTEIDANGRVVFGSTVHLVDAESGDEAQYRIVGEDESDIKDGLLSISSPIARALIGKEEGDMVDVAAPSGRRTYEIARVEYI